MTGKLREGNLDPTPEPDLESRKPKTREVYAEGTLK
jgi:hypothetical protein